ncbi:MAG: hypothetical protein ACN6OP_08680 [Pseudomonadales bacterium]
MDVTQVLITDMPGPAWWEVLFQWNAIFVQGAAAVATVAAVYAALHIAKQQERRELRRERRIGEVTHAAAVPALAPLMKNISMISQHIAFLRRDPINPRNSEFKQRILVLAGALSVEGFTRIFEWLYTLEGDKGMRVAALIPVVPELREYCETIGQSDSEPFARLRFQHSMDMAEAHIGQIADHVMSVLGIDLEDELATYVRGPVVAWRNRG